MPTLDIPRIDQRRLRLQPFLFEIMDIVSKHLNDEDHRRNALRELYSELFDKLHAAGVEILTDHMRIEMGLPPRGPDGWTREEILALEKRRLESIQAIFTPMVLE